MSNTCSICKHDDREEIDRLLVEGKSLRQIASQFNVGYKSLDRHKCHISPLLKKADYDIGKSLKCDVINMDEKIKDYLEKAERSEDLRVVHLFIGDALQLIGLKAKISGKDAPLVQVNTQVNLGTDPAWIAARSIIFEVLQKYPPALEDMRQRLSVLRLSP